MKEEKYLAAGYQITTREKLKNDDLAFELKLYTTITNLQGRAEKYLELSLPRSVAQLKDLIKKLENAIKKYVNRTTREEFIINKYLSVRLEGGRSQIYVAGRSFMICTYLLLNIPDEPTDHIQSIDEAAANYGDELHVGKERNETMYHIDISPEEEFIGNCSNLQAWAENGYDTRLLHSNLAWPLLKKLMEVGDKKARKAYKEEIALRLEENDLSATQYILGGGYINDLSIDEIKIINDSMNPGIAKILLEQYLEKKKAKSYGVVAGFRGHSFKFDPKKMGLQLMEGEIFVTSVERSLFEYKDYKRPFNLRNIQAYSKFEFNKTFYNFGIRWKDRKVLFKKANVEFAESLFNDKFSINIQIPRSRAPLKVYNKKENIAVYIYPELMF